MNHFLSELPRCPTHGVKDADVFSFDPAAVAAGWPEQLL